MKINKKKPFGRVIALCICALGFAVGVSIIGANPAFAKNVPYESERTECFSPPSNKKGKEHDVRGKHGGHGKHDKHCKNGRRDKHGKHCKNGGACGTAFLNKRFYRTFIDDTSALIEIETYRDDAPDSEQRITANLILIQ
ncbi:MAG: hypothetical protein GY942_04445, partial [Aestuariibacter sp.]|nr:hypothetical protein [Aestuariibacter sp.]